VNRVCSVIAAYLNGCFENANNFTPRNTGKYRNKMTLAVFDVSLAHKCSSKLESFFALVFAVFPAGYITIKYKQQEQKNLFYD
jgi:hypothetical protein